MSEEFAVEVAEEDTFELEDCGCDDGPTDPMPEVFKSKEPLRSKGPGDFSQWAVKGDNSFRAAHRTKKSLPPGIYGVSLDGDGNLIWSKKTVVTDDLMELPDSEGQNVLSAIRNFWTKKDRFRAKGRVFKRGILLHGPPGGGKTSVIMLLTNDLVKSGGIVLYVSHPELATMALTQLRAVEPERPIITILEDLDELVHRYGEHSLLNLLDGEAMVANIVFLATTNYPEQLAKRITNRPSRFDLVVKIGLPSEESRRVFFEKNMPELPKDELTKWVTDSKNFSIAHLREMIVAVHCLDGNYEEAIQRLKNMDKTLSSSGGNRIGLK